MFRKRSILLLSALLSLALLATGCDSDTTDPSNGGTGVMYGSVIVYDANLKRVPDMSGVSVRYVDTDGKSFEAVTNKDGIWEIEAPFGVYSLDTILKPGLIQLHPGSVKVAGGFHSGSAAKDPIDWLGKGRRQVLQATAFCPPELDEVISLTILSTTLDSIYHAGYTDDGITYPERHELSFSAKIQVDGILGGAQMNAQLVLPSGSQIPLQGSVYGRPIDLSSARYEIPWDSWNGARLECTVSASVEQTYLVRDGDSDWKSAFRVIPSKPTSINVQVIP